MIRPFGFHEFMFLVESTQWTLVLTLAAMTVGGLMGLCIALARVARSRVLRECTRTYIAVIQGIPVLMVLFLSYFGLAHAGLELELGDAGVLFGDAGP